MSAPLVQAGVKDSLALIDTSQLCGAESHLGVIALRTVFVDDSLTVFYIVSISIVLCIPMPESIRHLDRYGSGRCGRGWRGGNGRT